jgi:hypothetical protein
MTEPVADRTQELALLIDVARLLEKYGQATFKRLADSLDDPEFTATVRRLVGATANTLPAPRGRARDRASAERRRLIRLAERVSEVGGHTAGAPLLGFIQAVIDDETRLPRLKEIRSFAERNGLAAPTSTSRRNALAQVLDQLVSLPGETVEPLAAELYESARVDDRSLEGWSRIIEKSRAAVRG